MLNVGTRCFSFGEGFFGTFGGGLRNLFGFGRSFEIGLGFGQRSLRIDKRSLGALCIGVRFGK